MLSLNRLKISKHSIVTNVNLTKTIQPKHHKMFYHNITSKPKQIVQYMVNETTKNMNPVINFQHAHKTLRHLI
jgi:hypothetical protein